MHYLTSRFLCEPANYIIGYKFPIDFRKYISYNWGIGKMFPKNSHLEVNVMKVIFRSFEDGSHVSLDHVSRLSFLPDKYEIFYRAGSASLVAFFYFRSYSLLSAFDV